jgi:D-alanyl-D-alanine carboxypeptidase (penicillin-binding protein 5/6)
MSDGDGDGGAVPVPSLGPSGVSTLVAEKEPVPLVVPSLAPTPAPAGSAGPSPSPSPPVPTERPQRARRRRNRRIIRWSMVAALVVVLLSAGLVGAQRATRTVAQPSLSSVVRTTMKVPGSAPGLPWPPTGQAAVAVPALGYAQQSGPETPVPIASLTKMTTAVVILRDHPIAAGASGPSITVTADDVGQYHTDLQQDETNIPLQVGEQLTELQMLEALMNQSANDAAYSLATWDAGSEAAFVAKMNGLAVSLGADGTHYVDASGFDPLSVSTASDTLRIAAAGMAIPAFAAVAGMSTVSLPLVGTVHNIVKEIGTNGVVGIKSGYTSQAAGCMVLAGFRTIGGRSVLVLASALGQRVQSPAAPAGPTAPAGAATTPATATPATTTTTTTAPAAGGPSNAMEAQYPLLYTGPVVEGLLDASEAAVVPVALTTRGRAQAVASTRWGGDRQQVSVVSSRAAWLLGWPGQRVVTETGPPAGTGRRSDRDPVGTTVYSLGSQTEIVPLRLAHTVPVPSWWWRVLHG